MSIPTNIRSEAESALRAFCESHSSSDVAQQRYTYEFGSNAVVLIEQRPSFMNAAEWTSRPLAKFRYSEARDRWSLYWTDNNERWHMVTGVKGAKDLRTLLDVVVKDPLGVFWG